MSYPTRVPALNASPELPEWGQFRRGVTMFKQRQFVRHGSASNNMLRDHPGSQLKSAFQAFLAEKYLDRPIVKTGAQDY